MQINRFRFIASLGCIVALPAIGAGEPSRALQNFMEAHCIDCHDANTKKGNLDLAGLKYDLDDRRTFELWLRVYDRVKHREMPPTGRNRPQPKDIENAFASLQRDLTAADQARRKVVLRRLNRIEYENTVRDLFGIRADVRDLLPEDTIAYGFDTVGDALGVSVEQMQAYLHTADVVLDTVFGSAKPPVKIAKRSPFRDDLKSGIGKMFRATPDGVAIFHTGYNPSIYRAARIVTAGTYRWKIHARAFQSEKPVIMEVILGDVITKRRPHRVQGYYDLPVGPFTVIEFTDWFEPFDSIRIVPYGVPVAGRAGGNTKSAGMEVGDIEIEGPLEPWPPISRVNLLGKVDPKSGTLADAERILHKVLPRAFRRPTTSEDLAPFVKLVRDALAAGRPFEDALRFGLKAILCSPAFLYREEPTIDNGKRITPVALASRLSYFLWSSMPDEALLTAARIGELDTPTGLRAQVERMLTDAKAEAFRRNFVDQWLNLRDIDFTQPDNNLYPEFDAGLKTAMLDETRLYFAEMLQQNRDIREFIASDWTFLNARSAKHYGIPGVSGAGMRKVSLPTDSVRGGVLTHASVLKVTANGTNTSPVIRGNWVLAKIIGRPVPPPPAGVPAVEPDIRGTTTIRAQLAKHRSNASCAGCHNRMDPPGFALEAFDVIGGWRTWYRSLGEGERLNLPIDEGSPVMVRYRKGPGVDASGELSDGRRFADIRAFKKLLTDDPDQIARNLAEKLLTYGLGREIGFADRPEIEAIVAASKQDGYRFRSLLHAVVQNALFRRP